MDTITNKVGTVDMVIRATDQDSTLDKVVVRLVIHPINDPPLIEAVSDTNVFMNNENYPNDINIVVEGTDIEEPKENLTINSL